MAQIDWREMRGRMDEVAEALGVEVDRLTMRMSGTRRVHDVLNDLQVQHGPLADVPDEVAPMTSVIVCQHCNTPVRPVSAMSVGAPPGDDRMRCPLGHSAPFRTVYYAAIAASN